MLYRDTTCYIEYWVSHLPLVTQNVSIVHLTNFRDILLCYITIRQLTKPEEANWYSKSASRKSG